MMRMIFRCGWATAWAGAGDADGEASAELAAAPADAGWPARAAIIPRVADAVRPLLITRDAPA